LPWRPHGVARATLGIEQRGARRSLSRGRIEIGRHVGELELGAMEVGDRADRPDCARRHNAGRSLRQARAPPREQGGGGGGRRYDAPAIEPHHRDLEAVTFWSKAGGKTAPCSSRRSPPPSAGCSSELSDPACERQAGVPLPITTVDSPREPGPRWQHDDIGRRSCRPEMKAGAVHDVMIALSSDPGARAARRSRRRVVRQ